MFRCSFHLIQPGPATLCDRALIDQRRYTFACVSGAVGMKVDGFYQNGKRWRIKAS
jgi:hypothetical protein